jgi:hypothetical protein
MRDGRYASQLIDGPTRDPILDPSGLGGWTHLVFSLDGASIRVYRDGLLRARMPRLAPGPLTIGRSRIGNWDAGAYPLADRRRGLRADIDTLSIFARPMTDDEVRQRHESGRAPRMTPP